MIFSKIIMNNDERIDYLRKVLRGCYRKFKALVCAQATSAYKKPAIAEFESDRSSFERTFCLLAEAIVNQNRSYFSDLTSKVCFRVFPKACVSKSAKEHEDSISNCSVDEDFGITGLNFFFDGPIELFIFDVFLTLRIGGVVSDRKCWYANRFHRESFDKSGYPNYSNLYLFRYYFSQYQSWKNDAIKASEKLMDEKEDSCIISMDLTGYFYHVNGDINDIVKKSHKGWGNYDPELAFCIEMMQGAFNLFSKRISEFRLDVIGKTVLPIGLNLSCLLANLYLQEFDDVLSQQCVHYGRYVDDVILVVKGCDYDSFYDFAKACPSIFSVGETQEDDISLNGYPQLTIQREKCRVLKMYADGSKNVYSKIRTEEFSVSENNLFPNFNAHVEDLLDAIYKKRDYIKFREVSKAEIDPSALAKVVNGLVLLIKGAKSEPKKYKGFAHDLARNISGAQIIELYAKWEKLFLLFGLLGDRESLGDVKRKIRLAIENLKFSTKEIDLSVYGEDEQLWKKQIAALRRSLWLLFENAECAYSALVGVHRNNLRQTQYRLSGLYYGLAANFPMLGVMAQLPVSENLFSIPFGLFADAWDKGLDPFRIEFSPKAPRLCDYLFAAECCQIVKGQSFELADLYNRYYQDIGAHFDVCKEEIIIKQTETNVEQYDLIGVDLSHLKNQPITVDLSAIKIAVASIDLDKMAITIAKSLRATNKQTKRRTLNKQQPSDSAKRMLIELLNDAYSRDFGQNIASIKQANVAGEGKKETKERAIHEDPVSKETRKSPVHFVVFPEAFLPLQWIDLLEKFASETQSTITTGIRYVLYKDKAFNLVATIIPFYDSNYHKQSLIVLREKNAIPLYERNILHASGLSISEKEPSQYFVVKKNGITIAPLVCYEATDIKARSLLKDKTDFVFTVAFNKDIKYFSSIGMSSARDMFCFYIECNSSLYGSSSFAPYRNAFLPMASDKGGSRDHMQIITANLSRLRDYKRDYFMAYDSFEEFGSSDGEEKGLFKKPSAKTMKVKRED